MKSQIELTCEACGKPFKRHASEHKRNVAKGRRVFCSASCLSKSLHAHRLKQFHGKFSGNLKDGSEKDEYSSFRYYVSKSKSKQRTDKHGASNLTVEYLKQLWESQKGICPYTGYKMELPESTRDQHILGSPKKASLDRINSEIGYVEGNVEFVCLSVNLAKSQFTKEQMLDFFKLS